MRAPNNSRSSARAPYFFLPTFSLWKREIVRFYRQRNRIIGALLSPLLFWFVGVSHLPAYSISIGFSLLFALATYIAASVLVQRRPKARRDRFAAILVN
jgi:hypothetical protein